MFEKYRYLILAWISFLFVFISVYGGMKGECNKYYTRLTDF